MTLKASLTLLFCPPEGDNELEAEEAAARQQRHHHRRREGSMVVMCHAVWLVVS